MSAAGNVADQISALVETNRSLLEELRDQQREESRLANQRESLRGEIQERLEELRDLRPKRAPGPSRSELDELRERLASEERSSRELTHERDQLAREAATVREQLEPMERRMGALSRATRRLELEWEDITREVDATARAMVEIRGALESCVLADRGGRVRSPGRAESLEDLAAGLWNAPTPHEARVGAARATE